MGSLPRLSECLFETAGEVGFELRFARDGRRRATLTGRIKAVLILECQRCLEAVTFPVDADLSVAFVERHEQAVRLPETLDPFLVEAGQIHFMDVIEDELLLQLPQVAMHAQGACPVPLIEMFEDKPEALSAPTVGSPFAVLAELKGSKD